MSTDPIPGYSGPVAALVPGSVYIAERPGRGGRSQRTAIRNADLAAAHAAGVRVIVSLMRSRNALTEYARVGFSTRWHPLKDMVTARAELPRMANDIATTMGREPGAILIHCDRWSEWNAAAAAAILMRLGMAPDAAAALEIAESHGLPVGDFARKLTP